MKFLVLKPGLEFEEIEGDEFDSGLQAMQMAVGGYIELATGHFGYSDLPCDVDAWVNEEGLLLGLPINMITNSGFLVGNLVFTKTDEYGNTEGLSDEEIKRIESLIYDLPTMAEPKTEYPIPVLLS